MQDGDELRHVPLVSGLWHLNLVISQYVFSLLAHTFLKAFTQGRIYNQSGKYLIFLQVQRTSGGKSPGSRHFRTRSPNPRAPFIVGLRIEYLVRVSSGIA